MKPLMTLSLWFLAGASLSAYGLEIDPMVPPEIQFGGRAVATANASARDGTAPLPAHGTIDFSDSSLLLGFSKYLFNGPPRYGFATIGLRHPDNAGEIGNDVYLQEAHVGIGARAYELKFGRSRLRNHLLMFPTIRDEDLLEFTHVANAGSHVDTDVYELFGGVLDAQWFLGRGLIANTTLTARVATDNTPVVTQDNKINGANIGFAYALPTSVKFDRGIRYAGVAWDAQRVDELNDARLNAYLAGLVYNLNSNPEADWVWELQGIAVDGVGAANLSDKIGRARAKNNSLVTALRFNSRPYLQSRWQVAVTLALKDYPDFEAARIYAIAPSFLYRLGSGIDWVAQYTYRDLHGALAQQAGIEREHRFYTGVSFALDYTLNESVAERNSLLAIEHNMTSAYGPLREE